MDGFGASGKGDALYDYFGFTPDNIFDKGSELVKFYKNNKSVPNLNNVPDFPPFKTRSLDKKFTNEEKPDIQNERREINLHVDGMYTMKKEDERSKRNKNKTK